MSDETTKKDGTGTKRKAASRTKDDWLRSTRILVENSGIGTEIGAALQPFGYTATRLAEGRTLLDEAEALTLKQKSEYGQRYEATEAMSRAWKNADDAYLRDLKIARIALRDRTRARSAMMVDGPRNNSISGWLAQTNAFYGNLFNDEAALAAMAGFGRTLEALKADWDLVRDIEAKDAASRKESGEARGSTMARDKKVDELARWASDLRAIAKIAFASDPAKLKTLGITP
jgi:hypothetical protein